MNTIQYSNQKVSAASRGGPLGLALKIALAITVFCIFLPLMPVLPSAEPLDPSWTIGINQAVAQGLRFGKDVIFTFGPYASIYNKAFHPATEHLELIGSLYLAALYAIALLGVLKRASIAVLVAMWLLLAGFTTTYDCLFFSYGLLVAVYCWQTNSNTPIEGTGNSFFRLAIIGLLFTGFGLYPLIKGTLFAFYGAIACLTILFYAWHRKWIYVALIPLSMTLSMGIFWIYSGQNLQDLPGYYLSISSIISGYTDAMSIDGNPWEVIGYAITASLLALYILSTGGWNVKNLYLFLIFSLFLFINFKAGFVRHAHHAPRKSGCAQWTKESRRHTQDNKGSRSVMRRFFKCATRATGTATSPGSSASRKSDANRFTRLVCRGLRHETCESVHMQLLRGKQTLTALQLRLREKEVLPHLQGMQVVHCDVRDVLE